MLRLEPDSALEVAWAALAAGVGDRHHPMHLVTVATVRAGLPEVRYAVLRHADGDARAVHFHTDVRAPKAADLRAEPAVSLLFYDREAKVQLRLRASAELHHQDELARGVWAQTRLQSRENYLTPRAPSSVCEEGEPQEVPGRMPRTGEAGEAGYANFCVVRCVVGELDYLHLHHEGHRRLLFTWDGERWRHDWLTP